jgi:hypothetical protein
MYMALSPIILNDIKRKLEGDVLERLQKEKGGLRFFA